MFLPDKKLIELIKSRPPLVSRVCPDDVGRRDSQIQPASVDLTIGEIYVPGIPQNSLGGINAPRQHLSLQQGHTAVVRTRECLSVPNWVAAFGFPPSTVSLQGLLMTNPGHIDPGFIGQMHFTVINMGNAPYKLEVGDKIVSLSFFPVDPEPEYAFGALQPGRPAASAGLNEELLNRLSLDFMNIDSRAESISKRHANRAYIFAAILTFTGVIFNTILNSSDSPDVPSRDELLKLQTRLEKIETTKEIDGIEQRLNSLEEEMEGGNGE